MTYRWLLFDADGTLFDYEAAEQQALSATLAQFGVAFGPEVLATYQQVNGQLWRDFEQGLTTPDRIKTDRFTFLLDALGLSEPTPDPVLMGDAYLTILGTCVDLLPDALTVLNALAGKAHLALITNGLTRVQRARLAYSGLDAYFAAVVISEEEGVAKPDPGIFEVIFSRMGNPLRSEVLMIGDSLTSDIRGANRYGIDACWVNPAGLPRDPKVDVRYEIRSLLELLPIVTGGDGSEA
ncbi:MAG: YjjG family noncanonical pyrimidine nucleotidase [Anaerolineae bacterium]|jgi:YjjG family noncanonical pyrimidine nucleotidase|nr:YjjG family noncanonical pyrimidine nucleotidase [Anaerolineae bacterium]